MTACCCMRSRCSSCCACSRMSCMRSPMRDAMAAAGAGFLRTGGRGQVCEARVRFRALGPRGGAQTRGIAPAVQETPRPRAGKGSAQGHSGAWNASVRVLGQERIPPAARCRCQPPALASTALRRSHAVPSDLTSGASSFALPLPPRYLAAWRASSFPCLTRFYSELSNQRDPVQTCQILPLPLLSTRHGSHFTQ